MGFTEMEKSPFTSAVTPLVVPGTMTDAPGSALPAASTTLPLTTSGRGCGRELENSSIFVSLHF